MGTKELRTVMTAEETEKSTRVETKKRIKVEVGEKTTRAALKSMVPAPKSRILLAEAESFECPESDSHSSSCVYLVTRCP